MGWLNSLVGGESCPDVMCIQEHHIAESALDGVTNQARNVGYRGCWDAAVISEAGGTQAGTAVLARTHLATSVLN